jgi:hypothetical protein
VLAPVYALFVAWSIWSWARSVRNEQKSWRFRVATIGLFFCAGSSSLLLTFYAHLWMTRTLIAHGSTLWLIYYAGECSAGLGFLLAFAGRGELRLSALVINLVMVFQWYGMMIVGLLAEAFLSTAMYLCVTITVCAWLFDHLRAARRLRTDTRV